MTAGTCSEILEKAYRSAEGHLKKGFVTDAELGGRVAYVALCPSNRAGARFLLAATLAKIHKPTVDIRKPFIQAYADAEKANAYGGRNYDEQYVFEFITRHKLPCSSTTAFLTPAFRTKNIVLDLSQTLRGRPPELYQSILEILDAIQSNKASANDILRELSGSPSLSLRRRIPRPHIDLGRKSCGSTLTPPQTVRPAPSVMSRSRCWTMTRW